VAYVTSRLRGIELGIECLLVVVDAMRAGELGEDAMMIVNSVEHIWDTTTVAVGDTAVLHCSFDALFQQLPHGNVRRPHLSSLFSCVHY